MVPSSLPRTEPPDFPVHRRPPDGAPRESERQRQAPTRRPSDARTERSPACLTERGALAALASSRGAEVERAVREQEQVRRLVQLDARDEVWAAGLFPRSAKPMAEARRPSHGATIAALVARAARPRRRGRQDHERHNFEQEPDSHAVLQGLPRHADARRVGDGTTGPLLFDHLAPVDATRVASAGT